MHIIWYGQSLFKLTTQPQKDSQINIVIDPFDKSVGLRIPKMEADILLLTHKDYIDSGLVSGSPFLIDCPGEYEIKNIFIQGVSGFSRPHTNTLVAGAGEVHPVRNKISNGVKENTIYTIVAEDIRICHLGALNQKELTEEQLEKIGNIDVLMIPVGGVFTIDGSAAAKIINQIEPAIVIPMHYQFPKLKIESAAKPAVGLRVAKSGAELKLEGIDKFLKTMGMKSIEPQNKLMLKKKDITGEMKVVILEP